jgi:RND family efflux transporter MFP subunit
MKPAIAVILLLAVAGIAGVYWYRSTASSPVQAPSVAIQSVYTVAVRVAPMVESVASYGNLVSMRSVNIAPETPGVVRQVLFDDGQRVSAGTPLVLMDSGIAEAQLQSAHAQAESDMQNLRRTQLLSRQGLESTYTTEQAQARAAASQASVKINETKLGQLTLRAPFAGILASARVDVGAFLNSGDTIVRLEDTAELEVEFRLPSSVALQVTSQTPIHIQVPNSPDVAVPDGHLSFIDPAISTDTRSVLLRAVANNPRGGVRPGLYVRVRVDLSVHPTALVVPTAAIGNSLSESDVFVVDDKNIAHQRTVTVGLSDGAQVELLDGVKAGDRVVTVGRFRLRDGDEVKVAAPPARNSAL